VSRSALALASLLVLSVLTPVTPARAVAMRDSTTSESWRLANGLEVRVRAIPGAVGASISLAYRAGALHVPAGHAGLAPLLAELQYTAAAGSVPERTRNELTGLRPAGWDLRTNDHVVVLTEVATPAQLPGVLLQVAARAHGVQVSDSCFSRAMSLVRVTLGREALGDPGIALHRRVRNVAMGQNDASIFSDAQGKGLAGINAGAANQLLQRLYVPANATLALAGDFHGVDLRALVEKYFGDIPAGKAEPEAPSARLRAGTRVTQFGALELPIGVVGALAPSLDDTLHASFYLAAILAGDWWRERVGAPRPPLSTVFRYSVLDEPDIVRFYSQPDAGLTDTTTMVTRWGELLDGLRSQNFLLSVLDEARMSVDWLLGGTISRPVLRLMRRDVAPLRELSVSMAIRACWRGDDFWDAWRARFETTKLMPQKFLNYMLAPGNQAVVLLVPRH
jgi:hypothetical protein